MRLGGWVEWDVSARPAPGETECGDVCLAQPAVNGLLLAVIDGLGHGSGAAQAASRARDVLLRAPDDPLDALLTRCHRELRDTRGVVLTLAFISRRGRLAWLGVGNVEAVVVRADRKTKPARDSLMLLPGVVGQQMPTPRLSERDLSSGDLVVLATDGVRTAFVDSLSPADPPARTTRRVIEGFGKSFDDALVLAVVFLGGPQ